MVSRLGIAGIDPYIRRVSFEKHFEGLASEWQLDV
jgi:hypothetical protein